MNIYKNSKKINTLHLLFFIFTFTIIFSFCNISVSAKNKTTSSVKKLHFTKKYTTLTIGKRKKYMISNLPKNHYVKYSVTPKKSAFIGKNSGILKVKGAGKIKVTASIFEKNGRKIRTLTDNILVKNKKTPLPNTTFKVKKQLNSWNFTLTLKSSRILLRKEVSKSQLTLSLKKKKIKVKAFFTKLSKDGKNITYTIRSSKQHILCPGDSSSNGTYRIESTILPKSLTTKYKERINKNSISGFVLQQNGAPVSKAFVQIRTLNTTLGCYTNASGYYKLNQIKNPLSLSVTKKGFISQKITSLNISKRGTICENIIMKSSSDSNYSLDILVTDTSGIPLKNASVKILPANKNIFSSNITNSKQYLDSFSSNTILISGKTDKDGKISFTNVKNSTSGKYTKILFNNSTSFSYDSNFTFQTNNRISTENILNTSSSYLIYISNNTANHLTSTNYQACRISFSFSELYTNNAFLQIQLEKCSNINVNNLSIKWDSNLNPSNISTIDLSFYDTNSHEPLYKTSAGKKSFYTSNNSIRFANTISLSLQDGSYYLELRAKAEDGTPIGISYLSPLIISNGNIQRCEIVIQTPSFSRALIYLETADQSRLSNYSSTKQNATFYLYQIIDNHYFLVETLNSSPYINSSYNILTSDIIIPCLLEDNCYLLCSGLDDIVAKEYKIFMGKELNLSFSKEEAVFTPPSLQIVCINSNKHTTNICMPSDFDNTSLWISFSKKYSISQYAIRTSASYPNTVIAFYKTNGTLLTTTLIPLNQINSTTARSSAKNTITDIYKNKEILTTNQDSYQ